MNPAVKFRTPRLLGWLLHIIALKKYQNGIFSVSIFKIFALLTITFAISSFLILRGFGFILPIFLDIIPLMLMSAIVFLIINRNHYIIEAFGRNPVNFDELSSWKSITGVIGFFLSLSFSIGVFASNVFAVIGIDLDVAPRCLIYLQSDFTQVMISRILSATNFFPGLDYCIAKASDYQILLEYVFQGIIATFSIVFIAEYVKNRMI